MPKCKWCKENGDKEQMVRYEKPTTKLKKDGTFAVLNSYYHAECDILRIEDEKFKKKELKELDDLYQYLLNLHSLKNLDGRMFEKIQDFRNGTIKYGNQKIKNSKEGVSYREMLDTYKHMSKNIDYALRTKPFKSKWNEFAYMFGIMVNNVNDVIRLQKRNNEVRVPTEILSSDFNINTNINKQKKRDTLDISDFL